MKGSPCCAGLMRSCLHTYRTKTNLTQHIIQPLGGSSAKYGGVISQVWGGSSAKYGGVINQLWGGPSTDYGGGPSAKYGGVINQLWGGHQPTMGGAISQVWGGHQPTMGRPSTNYGGGGIFPPVCTGSQNPQNYFSNTYVLPSVNRTAGPTNRLPATASGAYKHRHTASERAGQGLSVQAGYRSSAVRESSPSSVDPCSSTPTRNPRSCGLNGGLTCWIIIQWDYYKHTE